MTIYVTMTDKFMSGWGGASNKVSKYVIECNDMEQAEAIEKAAHDRSEMKHVNICFKEPNYPGKQVTYRHFNGLGGPWLKHYNPVKQNTLTKMEIIKSVN